MAWFGGPHDAVTARSGEAGGGAACRFPLPGLEEVPGFLTPREAHLLVALSAAQKAWAVSGDVAEFGVFYGRSALVLGLGLTAGERLHACDDFSIGAREVPRWRFDADAPPEQFLRTRWNRWHDDPASLVIHRGDTRRLQPHDVGAPARLVHVDAGHGHDDVRADLDLASAALHPLGAIVADDVLLPEWPDVTVALLDRLRERDGDVVPVALFQHKAVLCPAGVARRYREWATEAMAACYPSPAYLCIERSFDGVSLPVASRVQDEPT